MQYCKRQGKYMVIMFSKDFFNKLFFFDLHEENNNNVFFCTVIQQPKTDKNHNSKLANTLCKPYTSL